MPTLLTAATRGTIRIGHTGRSVRRGRPSRERTCESASMRLYVPHAHYGACQCPNPGTNVSVRRNWLNGGGYHRHSDYEKGSRHASIGGTRPRMPPQPCTLRGLSAPSAHQFHHPPGRPWNAMCPGRTVFRQPVLRRPPATLATSKLHQHVAHREPAQTAGDHQSERQHRRSAAPALRIQTPTAQAAD